jgi:hypothetical protein
MQPTILQHFDNLLITEQNTLLIMSFVISRNLLSINFNNDIFLCHLFITEPTQRAGMANYYYLQRYLQKIREIIIYF